MNHHTKITKTEEDNMMEGMKQSAAADKLMETETHDIKEATDAPSTEDKPGSDIARTMNQRKNRLLLALGLGLFGSLCTWRVSSVIWGVALRLEKGVEQCQVPISGHLDEALALTNAKLTHAGAKQLDLGKETTQKLIGAYYDVMETQAALLRVLNEQRKALGRPFGEVFDRLGVDLEAIDLHPMSPLTYVDSRLELRTFARPTLDNLAAFPSAPISCEAFEALVAVARFRLSYAAEQLALSKESIQRLANAYDDMVASQMNILRGLTKVRTVLGSPFEVILDRLVVDPDVLDSLPLPSLAYLDPNLEPTFLITTLGTLPELQTMSNISTDAVTDEIGERLTMCSGGCQENVKLQRMTCPSSVEGAAIHVPLSLELISR